MDSAKSADSERAEHAKGRDERLVEAQADATTLESWWPQRILIGAALWLAGAALLFGLGLYFAAHRTATLPGDKGILALVQHIQQPLLVGLINLASDANWPQPAAITVFAVTLVLLFARRFRAAICALAVGFIADFTSFFLLNDWVKRIRPKDISLHTFQGIGAWSYPSGHVVHVTAFYGFLYYLAWHEQRFHPSWIPALRVVQVVCGYFIVFIGLSRLLEDDHWSSDVLAGYLLGAMMLAAAIVLYHALALAWLHREGLRVRLGLRHG
ncbi:MAG TPA: phosphatase PAP2 family protein [Ktedonobacterales bacterium]